MRGHSFLPCDRDFDLIKQNFNTIVRLYTPNQYTDIITDTSSKNSYKFRVMIVDSSMVKNYQKWFTTYYAKNTGAIETRMLSTNNQRKFLISSYHF